MDEEEQIDEIKNAVQEMERVGTLTSCILFNNVLLVRGTERICTPLLTVDHPAVSS